MALLRFLVSYALILMNADFTLIAHSAVVTGSENVPQHSTWSSHGNRSAAVADGNMTKGPEFQLNHPKRVNEIPVNARYEPKITADIRVVNETSSGGHTEGSETPTEKGRNDVLQLLTVRGSVRDEIENLFLGPQHIVPRSVNVTSEDAENDFLANGTMNNEPTTNVTLEGDDGGHSRDLQQDSQAETGCSVTYFASEKGDCALALEFKGPPPAWFMENILPDDLGAVDEEHLRSFGQNQACGCPAPDLSSTCPDALRAALATVTAACDALADGGSGEEP